MWGTIEVLERLERRVKDVEVLLKEFTDAMVLDGRKLYGRLNKLENKVDTLGLKEQRIATLEQQVNDLMNENVDLISHLRLLEKKLSPKEKELKIYRDEERGGYVLKEKELEPRIGDLVVSRTNPTDFRKVLSNGFGLQVAGMNEIKMYNRGDLVKDFMSEWKVIARKEDLK